MSKTKPNIDKITKYISFDEFIYMLNENGFKNVGEYKVLNSDSIVNSLTNAKSKLAFVTLKSNLKEYLFFDYVFFVNKIINKDQQIHVCFKKEKISFVGLYDMNTDSEKKIDLKELEKYVFTK